MLENPDIEQKNCSKTAQGVYKSAHYIVRLMK